MGSSVFGVKMAKDVTRAEGLRRRGLSGVREAERRRGCRGMNKRQEMMGNGDGAGTTE